MVRVVIVNDASVARGGATGLALLQARLLCEKGVDTVFVAADEGRNDDLAALGLRVYAAGAKPLMKSAPHVAATRGLHNRDVAALLNEVIDAEDGPETVYHVHSWSKTLTPAAFTALQRVASRTFIHAHDFFLACPNGGFMDYRAMEPCHRTPLSPACLMTNCDKRNYAQKAWRVARQLVLHRAMPRGRTWGAILLIHPAMAPLLRQSGYSGQNLVTLRNPATPLSPVRITSEKNDRFLFIGRIEPEKGIEELVHAAADAEVPLTVVGEGPLRSRLEREHPEVIFTGWLDRPVMLDAARHARALVMPTRYPEPFGLVAAEASLSGLPVLTSDTALLGPEISSAGLGWRCDTRDREKLASKLREIAGLPSGQIAKISLRAASGEAGLCTTPDTWIESLITLYSSTLVRQ